MKLVVGLGNPGKEYKNTRHNIGFQCLDLYASKHNVTFSMKKKFNGEILKANDVLLLKPMTFMNRSGESVYAVMDYYDIDWEDLIVIYDDLDLNVGRLRLREKGSSGGHNGIKSIIKHIHTKEFKRVRLGIGKNPLIQTSDYVLGRFKEDEIDLARESVKKVANLIEDIVDDKSFIYLMNTYNN